MIEFSKPYNYYDINLEKQLQSLYITYITSKSKKEILDSLSSILHIIYKLRNEKNVNYNIYITYLIIIMFHKRQFKNNKLNKNSKDIFYESVIMIYDYDYKLVTTLIYNDLFALYGYDKDYIQIWKKVICKMKTDYSIKNPKKTRINWFYHFFKKYNPLIVSLSSILLFKKSRDLKSFDDFLKINSELATKYNVINNWSKFGIEHLLNDSSKEKHFKIITFFNSVVKYYDFDNMSDSDIRLAYLSKVAMWLPREGRNKDVYWFIRPYRRNISLKQSNFYNEPNKEYEINYIPYQMDKNNYKFKKMSCFNYLVLYDKISYHNIQCNVVNNLDKKRFRTTSSILNIILDTPQVSMCRNKFQDINFNKCGSKFIKLNSDLFSMEKIKNITRLSNKIDRKLCKIKFTNFIELKKKSKKNNFSSTSIINNNNNNNQLDIFLTKKKMNIMNDDNMIKKILNHKKYEIIYTIINEYFV